MNLLKQKKVKKLLYNKRYNSLNNKNTEKCLFSIASNFKVKKSKKLVRSLQKVLCSTRIAPLWALV